MRLTALTQAQRDAYESTLSGSHKTRVRTFLRDVNGENIIGPLTGIVLEGQVDIDATQPITRQLRLELADVGRKVVFDPAAPDDGLYLNRIISVEYHVYSTAVGDWVEVPVFYGPISRFERRATSISIEAQSKAALLAGRVYTGARLQSSIASNPSKLITNVVKNILSDLGENKFRIDVAHPKKVDPKVVKPDDTYDAWQLVLLLAGAANLHAFYDNEGFFCLEPWPTSRSSWRFAVGSNVVTQPAVSYDLSQARNRVEVYGENTKSPLAVAQLPPSHPLSPQQLQWNGQPRQLIEIVTDSSLGERAPKNASAADKRKANQMLAKDKKHAKDIADATLKRLTGGLMDVSFDALPVPHLVEGDLATLDAPNLRANFVLNRWSLPLRPGTMSVGYNRRYATSAKG